MKKIGLLILAVVITGISLSSFLLVSNSTPSKAERCKEMEGKERDYCYFEAARYGYAEGCEKISDVELKDSCFLQAAKIQNRKIFTSPLDLCEKIGDEESGARDLCWWNVANMKRDWSLCNRIDNPETRLKCSNLPKNIGIYP